jgi:hypothetical protein
MRRRALCCGEGGIAKVIGERIDDRRLAKKKERGAGRKGLLWERMNRVGSAAVFVGWSLMLVACDLERNAQPIIIRAKPPLIEHQFCIALRDAEREPQDSVVMRGTVRHGRRDTFHVRCDGEEREMLFALVVPGDDDFGMKELRKQWNKKTGIRDLACGRCPKYDITAKFVGMVKKDESGRLVFVAQTADEVRRIRIQRGK